MYISVGYRCKHIGIGGEEYGMARCVGRIKCKGIEDMGITRVQV
jgi:hypothetical protein